jgi:hypothetical protein
MRFTSPTLSEILLDVVGAVWRYKRPDFVGNFNMRTHFRAALVFEKHITRSQYGTGFSLSTRVSNHPQLVELREAVGGRRRLPHAGGRLRARAVYW